MRYKNFDIAEVSDQAIAIVDDFGPNFTSGTNVLILLQRKKDGGHNKEFRRRLSWFVVHNQEHYISALTKLLVMKYAFHDQDLRIYATVNPRSLKKAEKLFKQTMLELDFSSEENHNYFWQRLESKWISALMNNKSRDRSYFQWDIDDIDGQDQHGSFLKELPEDTEIIKQYRTKNGWHIITKPFNPDVLSLSPQRDGMLLLAY